MRLLTAALLAITVGVLAGPAAADPDLASHHPIEVLPPTAGTLAPPRLAGGSIITRTDDAALRVQWLSGRLETDRADGGRTVRDRDVEDAMAAIIAERRARLRGGFVQ